MGLFDDYNINIDEVKESSFDINPGTYNFEISEAEQLDGTNAKPDTTFFYIEYQLTDEDGDSAGSTREFFTLAEDGDSETKRVTQSMGFLKSRLKSLGITDLKGFDGEELVGLTGVLQVVVTLGKGANKGKSFTNIKNVRLDGADDEEQVAPVVKKAPAKKPVAKTAAKPTISKEDAEAKARVKAKQAARAAAEAESEDDEDDEDNPFGG